MDPACQLIYGKPRMPTEWHESQLEMRAGQEKMKTKISASLENMSDNQEEMRAHEKCWPRNQGSNM
jgi:hypothetical protein